MPLDNPQIDPVLAAELLIRRLCRPIASVPGNCVAVAETETPFGGDDWFWTDDNAKVLEFLARPEIWERYCRYSEGILNFLRLMCRGPLIYRRVGAPRLLQVGQENTTTSYYHSLMHLRADLPHGVVIAGLRFHDNRTADDVVFTANAVAFTYHRRRFTVTVEQAIDDVESTLDGDTLTLRHSGDIWFKPYLRPLRLGRLTYVYTVKSQAMTIGVEVVLELDPRIEVRDVALTIGQDHLSRNPVERHYGSVVTDTNGAARLSAGRPGRRRVAAAGTSYYGIVQNEIAGFAGAIHSAPRDPGALAALEILVRKSEHLHFVRARYRFDGPHRGSRLAAAEDKLLTSGGFYQRVADYARLMRDPAALNPVPGTACDVSVSYDYGAEINAFASCFAVLSGRDPSHAAELRALCDTYLDFYFALFIDAHRQQLNAVFCRQLAFVMLAAATMYRATGEPAYRDRLGQLCEVMLDFEKQFEDIAGGAASGFLMGVHSSRIVFVDCHSAALLALAVAAGILSDPRLPEAIDRGLGAYCLETARIEWFSPPGLHKFDVVGVNWIDDGGARHINNAFWNFHVGLTLRFFAVLRKSPNPALQAVAAKHRDRIELFERLMRRQLDRSVTRYDDSVEIRCSILSAETNSETQPWVMLGLLEAAA